MPPSAVRSRYLEKLKNPRELLRLARGGVDMRKLASGLVSAARSKSAQSSLAEEIERGLAQYTGRVIILLAGRDRTAAAFAEHWPNDDDRIVRCENATHAYVEEQSAQWLQQQLLAALRA